MVKSLLAKFPWNSEQRCAPCRSCVSTLSSQYLQPLDLVLYPLRNCQIPNSNCAVAIVSQNRMQVLGQNACTVQNIFSLTRLRYFRRYICHERHGAGECFDCRTWFAATEPENVSSDTLSWIPRGRMSSAVRRNRERSGWIIVYDFIGYWGC